MIIRIGTHNDLPFLEHMLFEAFFWNPDYPRPEVQKFMQHPEFRKLLSDWGRVGDKAVIAEENETPIGAAWYRLWTAENHSYGFVDSETPELGMAVRASHRGKGAGRMLLRGLIAAASEDGFRALSLSVDPSNFARQLYESEGFIKVGESGTSCTMKRNLCL
ncbi:MAG: GNAT family N-acetyltransferase [candidate division KSB1 bacterium]